MGSCHSSETSPLDVSEHLNQLIDENLLLLRGILMHFVSASQLKTALKVKNVNQITHDYYCKLRQDREFALNRMHRLNTVEFACFERNLSKEEEQLKQANDSLMKEYKRLRHKWFGPSTSSLTDFIYSVEESHCSVLTELDKVHRESIRSEGPWQLGGERIR